MELYNLDNKGNVILTHVGRVRNMVATRIICSPHKNPPMHIMCLLQFKKVRLVQVNK